VKFRTIIVAIIVTSLLQNITIKCCNEEIKELNKTCKASESAVVYFTFSFCVIFIVEVYTAFFGKKWVALKRASFSVAVKRTGYCY